MQQNAEQYHITSIINQNKAEKIFIIMGSMSVINNMSEVR